MLAELPVHLPLVFKCTVLACRLAEFLSLNPKPMRTVVNRNKHGTGTTAGVPAQGAELRGRKAQSDWATRTPERKLDPKRVHGVKKSLNPMGDWAIHLAETICVQGYYLGEDHRGY